MFYVHFCGRDLGKCSDTDPYICEGRSVVTGRGDELIFEYDSGNFLEFRSAKKCTDLSTYLCYGAKVERWPDIASRSGIRV